MKFTRFTRILPLLLAALMAPFLMNAQVTTSSITGFVKSDKGEALEGATITAIHQPSGTKYITLTKKDGNFTLPNTRVGGPFQLTVEFVGFEPQTIDNITLNLGEPYIADVTLSEKANVLSEITIAATTNRPTTSKTGASTVFNSRQIASSPSLTRSITDFTRLTPQASGNNFAGRDGRFNNLQIDGANLNNNFGLSTDPLPGGGASPISIEAFDEISVNIAPYDVRQSGFTGAGLNVITKSGTNTFHGSAYGYYRDQSFNGTHAGKVELTPTPQKNKVYGATLGGPIIKNKLFFFMNAEWENQSTPNPNTFIPTGSNASGTVSAAPKDSLDKFRDVLKTKYNYDAGAYDNRPNFITKNRKLLAKIDWNISNKHKLTVKYSDFKGSDQSPLNGSSVPNSGAGQFSIRGISGTQSRLPNNRNSAQSIGFSNSDYATDHIVKSGTLELNSNFNSKVSNQLLLAYTHINDVRNSPAGIFPTIEIFDADGTVDGVTKGRNYMSAGTDPFTRNNEVINNIATITDNFTYFAGKHTLTAGATYEYQKVGNAFMGGSESYYIYNSLNDFITDATPAFFSYTYSLVPGQPKVFSADLKLGQLGVYVQDEFNINQNFKLTYGVRGDLPTYLEKPIENTAITALQFPDKDGVMTNFSTGKWPKAKLLLSPRVGFRWRVPDEKGLVLRGGTGVFTGKIPFVFLTNMPSGSGVYQNGAVLNTPELLAGVTFNPNPDAYLSKFPSTITAKAPGSFTLIDPNFKFPQVFRTNFGIDKQLGNGFVATVDLLYTKDLNAVKMRNANLVAPSASLTGADNRLYYPTSAPKVNPGVGTVIVLENTKKGYSFASTAQLSKSFSKGFFGSIAYTYTLATEVSPNPGSQATSAWQSIINRGTPNDEELYNSAYSVPHRVVGNLSYRFEYANHFATTISLYYEGANQARYSYIIGGDLNNDGNSTSDLMFIYAKGSEVPFVDATVTSGGVTTVKYTVAQQQAAYDELIANTPYLKKHAGQYAERNSALTPWYNRMDARILQDFYVKTGNTKHTLQFSVDVINLPNLLNKDWGIRDLYILNNPLTRKSSAGAASPTYNLAENSTTKQLINTPFQKNTSFSTTWGMQLGLRYIF
jgi:outer membrane receptor protein involved in Fe transport